MKGRLSREICLYIQYLTVLRDPSKVRLDTTCSRVNQEMTFKQAEFGRIFFDFGACYKVF